MILNDDDETAPSCVRLAGPSLASAGVENKTLPASDDDYDDIYIFDYIHIYIYDDCDNDD